MATGKPGALNPHEPANIAEAVGKLGLGHVVGRRRSTATTWTMAGAGHFAQVITALHKSAPTTTVEILTPDFMRKPGAIETVVASRPDVFNHNLETVPRLYPTIRPGARYFTSLRLLSRVKEIDPAMFTKSGLMVGLGETREEITPGDGRPARRRRRFPDDRPVSAADAQACRARPLLDARRVLGAGRRWHAPRAS